MPEEHDLSSSSKPEHATLRESLLDFAIIKLDLNGRIVEWSPGAEKIFGFREAEVVGQYFGFLFTPEDQAANIPSVEVSRALRSDASEDQRWHVRKDGSRIYLSGMVRALHDENERLIGFTKVARETTSHKLAELQREELLKREQAGRTDAERKWKHLEEISENIPALIALVRLPDQTFVFANRIFREVMGNRVIVGRTLRDVQPFSLELFEVFNTTAATGTAYAATERLVRLGDIGDRYLDSIFQPMRSEAGGYEAILIFAMDVTERVRTRQSLEALTGELRTERQQLTTEIADRKHAQEMAEERAATVQEQAELLDLARDAILTLRADATVEFWNRGAEELYGWSKEEASGRNVHDLLRTEFPQPLAEIKAIMVAKGQWAGELKQRSRHGQPIEVSSRWVPRNHDTLASGWLEVNRDITERKRIEANLLDRQKLESLGVLAGGIAHDFNNLLMGIMGNISLALDASQPGSAIYKFLTDSLEASEKAALLVKQMLAYAGKGQYFVQSVDLSDAVRQTISFVRTLLPKNVSLELGLVDRLPHIQADMTQLQQVVMNLVLNAAEAAAESSGKVVVRTGIQEMDPDAAAIACDVGAPPVGRSLKLEVLDTGPGIDPSIRTKLFDPFFSTKFTGRGLGLAAVSGIVRAMNGAVRVDSTPGQGSTFSVFFPIGVDQAVTERKVSELRRPPILVADDEEIVLRTVEAMLRTGGYDVLVAHNGNEAVDTFRHLQGRIALVLLDMTMPGITSEEALHQLKAIRADVPVVISSGYSEEEALQRFGDLGVAAFIQKPYTSRSLLEKISGLLKWR